MKTGPRLKNLVPHNGKSRAELNECAFNSDFSGGNSGTKVLICKYLKLQVDNPDLLLRILFSGFHLCASLLRYEIREIPPVNLRVQPQVPPDLRSQSPRPAQPSPMFQHGLSRAFLPRKYRGASLFTNSDRSPRIRRIISARRPGSVSIFAPTNNGPAVVSNEHEPRRTNHEPRRTGFMTFLRNNGHDFG